MWMLLNGNQKVWLRDEWTGGEGKIVLSQVRGAAGGGGGGGKRLNWGREGVAAKVIVSCAVEGRVDVCAGYGNGAAAGENP